MRRPVAYMVGALLLMALAVYIWVQYISDADEILRLQRYDPYGNHFIDTTLTGGKVKWTSREVMIWKVSRKSREFSSVDEFKVAFLNEAVHKQANISVHDPTLNLNRKEGRESHERTQEILAFLSANGYENAGGVSN